MSKFLSSCFSLDISSTKAAAPSIISRPIASSSVSVRIGVSNLRRSSNPRIVGVVSKSRAVSHAV